MQILKIKELAIPEIKVVKFKRFTDHRGYFTETFRRSDFFKEVFKKKLAPEFVQANESWSRSSTFRGLHMQWNPHMGKLVRCVVGHLIDYVLDIRLESPTFGKIIGYDMPVSINNDYSEWIWVPPGFAHGTLLIEDSLIEYFCTGEYSQNHEAGISPLDNDLDWSLCNNDLTMKFKAAVWNSSFLTDKDRENPSLAAWKKGPNAKEFTYENCKG